LDRPVAWWAADRRSLPGVPQRWVQIESARWVRSWSGYPGRTRNKIAAPAESASDAGPELILIERIRQWGEIVARIQREIADGLGRAPMNVIGSRLGDYAYDPARRPAIHGGHVARIHVEGLCRLGGSKGQVALGVAAVGVRPAQPVGGSVGESAISLDMGLSRATAAFALSFAALRRGIRRAGSKKQRLFQFASVHGQRRDALLINELVHRGDLCNIERKIRRNQHLVRNGAHLQYNIPARSLAGREGNARLHARGETNHIHGELVASRRQAGKEIFACDSGPYCLLRSALRFPGGNACARHRGACRIGHDPFQSRCAELRACRRGPECSGQKSQGSHPGATPASLASSHPCPIGVRARIRIRSPPPATREAQDWGHFGSPHCAERRGDPGHNSWGHRGQLFRREAAALGQEFAAHPRFREFTLAGLFGI
jgi:hypothetical protein